MGYSKEVLQRARARLEQAKAERESEYQRNLTVAYTVSHGSRKSIWSCAVP